MFNYRFDDLPWRCAPYQCSTVNAETKREGALPPQAQSWGGSAPSPGTGAAFPSRVLHRRERVPQQPGMLLLLRSS